MSLTSNELQSKYIGNSDRSYFRQKKNDQKINDRAENYHIKVMATALHKNTYIINCLIHHWLICIVKKNIREKKSNVMGS